MSREMVAWVTAKPRPASRSASSCWLAIASDATISRMARWRSGLAVWALDPFGASEARPPLTLR